MSISQRRACIPDAPIERLAERPVWRNRFIAVYDDPVRLPDGCTGSYVRIVQSDGNPGVAVLPLHQGRAGLVRVFRYPRSEWEWGIPRGLAHGRDPEATAMEEAREELGSRPGRVDEIGQMTPDSGLLTSVVHIFAAAYTDEPAMPLDRQEAREVRWIPARQLLDDIARTKIRDGFTQAALCCAVARGLIRA